MFIRPRWSKILHDILDNKSRTLLVVMAIAVGVFAFGSVFILRDILLGDMNASYSATNPATIIIRHPGSDASFVRMVERQPQVVQAEAATRVPVRLMIDGRSVPLVLVARVDYSNLVINIIDPETGQYPPGRNEVLLERSALSAFPLEIGDLLSIETPIGSERDLVLAGTVHDLDTVPFSLYPELTGFVTDETLRYIGHSGTPTQVQITTPPELDTQVELEEAASEIKLTLERYGYENLRTTVSLPGEHWAADTTRAVTTILTGVGFFALILSGFLVVNTITAVLAQQRRQIGIMKTVGASNAVTTRLYLTMVAIFGAMSLVFALPVGAFLAFVVVQIIAMFLNIDISSFRIPVPILLMQIGVAILVPVLAALLPVIQGTRITVREAISDYGLSSGDDNGIIERILDRIHGLPRPTMLSLRNSFRAKARLLLTLVILTFAGAVFVALVNVRLSLIQELESLTELFQYDIQIVVNRPLRLSQIENIGGQVEGVTAVEGWAFTEAVRLRPDGSLSSAFTIFGPPHDSPFVRPTLVEGRWLQEGDTNALVVGTEFLRYEPDLGVGDEINVEINGVRSRWQIVGIINIVGQTSVYANFDYLARVTGTPRQSYVMIAGLSNSEQAEQKSVELRDELEANGIGTVDILTISTIIGAAIGQFNLLISLLLGMAVLLAALGGLGLAGTMSLNVLERTREIGVMRSMGATDRAIRSIVISEGLFIGLLSCSLAFALSFPLTGILARVVGQALFERSLGFAFTPAGIIAWVIIALLVATIASLLPARRASRISIQEALAYQ